MGQMPDMLSLVSGQGEVEKGDAKEDDPSWRLIFILTAILSVAVSGDVVLWTAITFSER